jgi:hypothetical protein
VASADPRKGHAPRAGLYADALQRGAVRREVLAWDADQIGVRTATDPGAAAARVDAAILTAQAGDLVYLSNTAPYIRRLEYGWSKQAPAGFIRLALAAGQQIADEVGAFVVEKYGGTAG